MILVVEWSIAGNMPANCNLRAKLPDKKPRSDSLSVIVAAGKDNGSNDNTVTTVLVLGFPEESSDGAEEKRHRWFTGGLEFYTGLLKDRQSNGRTAMSTDDFHSAPQPDSHTRRATPPILIIGRTLLIGFIVLPFIPFFLGAVLFMLCLAVDDNGTTDGPAPDANYAIRRTWGEENLRHHFEAAEKWIHSSSQIAKDVGRVSGIAPIGSPNRFKAGFADSEADMNLQVIGDKGEGVLCLPGFSADGYPTVDYRDNYRFHNGSWTFENRRRPIFKNGKSRMERLGVDSLYDQVFDFAEQEDHTSVVMTCRILDQTLKDNKHPSSMFWRLENTDRLDLLKLYADSLAETSNKTESANMYAQAAAIEFKPVLEKLLDYRGTTQEDQVLSDLEKVNALLKKAQALEPNKDSILKMASLRTLFAYKLQSGTMLFKYEKPDSDRRQQLIRRELKGLFEYAEQLAKRSPHLRAELGAITTRPRFKYTRLPKETKIEWSGMPIEFARAWPEILCEDYCSLHLNPASGYQSYIGVTIEGANGKTGKLLVFVQENNSPESGLDLFCETPSGPSESNLTASLIRWKEKGKRSVSLSPDTLVPIEEK